MHTCVCVRVYDCVYTYIYIYIHIHVYVYIYIHIHICIYVLYTKTLKGSLRTSGTFPATEGTARIAGPAAKDAWPNDRNYEIQGLPTIYHKTSKHTCLRVLRFKGLGLVVALRCWTSSAFFSRGPQRHSRESEAMTPQSGTKPCKRNEGETGCRKS